MQSLLDAINPYSNLIIAIVTTAYAFLTFFIVKESRQERLNQKMPVIAFRFRHIRYPDGQQVIKETQERIVNIGSGPALDINLRTNGEFGDLKIDMFEKDEEGLMPWPTQFVVDNALGPDNGDSDMQICFNVSLGQVSLLKNPKLILKATYKDVFGRRYKTIFKDCKNGFERLDG